MPLLIDWINRHPSDYQKAPGEIQLLWITPLRALARDIQQNMQRVADDLDLPWRIERRTGDVSASIKRKQRKQLPEVLITTPESLHILMAQKGYAKRFRGLRAVVVDEWHELLGSKRGTQVELGLSRLTALLPELRVWGVSATIGNLNQALEVLVGPTSATPEESTIIKADIQKEIHSETIIPDKVDQFPWAGHLGIRLLEKVIPVIEQSRSTLIFTNTRSQAEIWFQNLLDTKPELAGTIALHHGSLGNELRTWVEQALHKGDLKAVVCTSSLDLGVDFSPVETVVQIGSPKGIARYLQRAGRSGHQPGARSSIYFVPTHALELIEATALRKSVDEAAMEERQPVLKPLDVLIQYLVTLGISDGFDADQIYDEVTRTFAYQALRDDEWHWILTFLTTGGESLHRYREYRKLEIDEDGRYAVNDRTIKRRHRMSIGTIVSDSSMRVKYLKGKTLGTIEETFIASLKIGDIFWFAGRNLELVKTKNMIAYVRRAKRRKGIVPRWMGGRMSLSSNLSTRLREQLYLADQEPTDPELLAIQPIIDVQRNRSLIPDPDELLMEYTTSREGHHLFVFPFEGRQVHEGLSALIAYRLSRLQPQTFSIAMNDYGFELLSDRPIPIEQALEADLFRSDHLVDDILSSLNATEMAKRRFREIGTIAGLVFKGYPGQGKGQKHLQMSTGLLFDVLSEHEPDHLLIQQAYDEVLENQLDEQRIRLTLQRIGKQRIRLEHPDKISPLAFPIMVDRLREGLSSEQLLDRIQRLTVQLAE
jgi:ATP-dependent Lhr-like helicase